ncbi:Rhamnolipids biosynthesis 3-oxoacyl-[acyl-carrier-protein] reductase [Geodia barretti]|uniref:Rhamnolipids biosynthesis 3-oxoacyl-[acyl-carrier-protein] reductase n=1 Tax=Geodia barretti TaxID=519541 RepID=A0AA35T5P1_GEOBA|nr:Rhamnolipids biosynthesis 3-oxoacyl-[acyl-carrier-protein] reductase [Geodia barretti]
MPMNIDRLTEMFGLDGKSAVVTGGSRGLGYMIAGGLLDAGCRVIISARKVEQVTAAAGQLAARGPCEAIPADLSTPEGCEALAAAVAERWESLDILVNNAGASWGAKLDEYPVDGWRKVIDINLGGPFFLTQKLLGLLRAAARPDDPARVINVASVDGMKHITVNAIAPGPFDSKMMAFILDNPKARAALAAEVPLGRIGEPDDLAGAAVYLASRAGSYLTGATVPVGGGLACAD